MRIFTLILCFLLSACSSEYVELTPVLNKKYHAEHHKTVDDLKRYYFTDEAYELIKDIPAVDGPTVGGSYACGTTFLSRVAGLISFVGPGRKCVMADESIENFGPEAFIHEYIHHIDDISRDEGLGLIDLEAFKRAYHITAKSPRWAGLVYYTEVRANRWFTDVFGMGEYSEYIAYIGARLVFQQSGPDELWSVFRKVLRRHEKGTR